MNMEEMKNSVRNAPQGSIVIAIDGPAGAGKSTLSRELAKQIGFFILDTGALYRAMALGLLRQGCSVDSSIVPPDLLGEIKIRVEPCKTSMKLFLNNELLGDEIRDEYVGSAASRFAVLPEVRQALLDTQRDLAKSWNIVAEGRDMGIVVFPDAFIKFFVTAELEERAKRRFTELLERGEKPYYSVVLNEMRARDIRDESRKTAPLAPASDSIVIDTTHLTPKAALNKMLELIEAKYEISG